MTAYPAAEIACDYPGCYRARSDYGTAAQVRQDARKKEGFRSLRWSGTTLDLCDDHAKLSNEEGPGRGRGGGCVMTRLIVTGSRAHDDRLLIAAVLTPIYRAYPAAVLVNGFQRSVRYESSDPYYFGADWLCRWVWRCLGGDVDDQPADWPNCAPGCKPGHRRRRRDGTEYCPTAGYRRNQTMVNGGGDICLGFPWDTGKNRGTNDCLCRAKTAGIPTVTIRQGEPLPFSEIARHLPLLRPLCTPDLRRTDR